MNDKPDWTKNAKRIEQPTIDCWYKPEQGVLDGRLVGQSDRENRFRPGEVSHVFVIQEERTRLLMAVSERPPFRSLRAATIGSRVCIVPTGNKDVPNGKGGTFKSWDFEIYIDETSPPPDDVPPPESPPPF